ncbi:MAG: hypothetical protein QXL45_03750 [Candidatus Bathyarchaeia archaeon]
MRSDKRGQFVILAAVIIAVFMFSLVLTISQISTGRQEVAYEPIDESVLAITGDFERCLTEALAMVTQRIYYDEGAKDVGEKFIKDWLVATSESYNSFGINIVLTPENSAGSNYVDWFIDWEKGKGISAVHATFGMDIEAYGLKNLAITLQKVLRLEILDSEINSSDTGASLSITFKVWEEGENKKFNFIADLTPSNLELLANGSIYEVSNFIYVGQGTYKCTFNFNSLTAEKISLIVTLNDGVKVGANLEICTLTLKSDDLATPGIDNGGNFTVNGTSLSPQRTLLLISGRTLNISFTPPEGCVFIDFQVDNIADMEQDGNTMVINVTAGLLNIVAQYKSTANLTLTSDDLATPGIDNGGNFTVNGVTYSPPSTLSLLLPPQTLTISFTPPEGSFINFTSSGPIEIINSNGSSAIMNITGSGQANIIAYYDSSSSIPPENPPENPPAAPSFCYITFTSRKYDNNVVNKGTFLLLFPNGTLCVFIDELTSEFLKELSEALEKIAGMLDAEIEVDLINLVNNSLFTLKVLPVNDFPVPYNQTLRLIYIPRIGYLFKSWEVDGTITVRKSLSLGFFAYMRFVALGNGTIVAVYEGSRPSEWRVLYISPEEGSSGSKKDSFVLELIPELWPEQITPPLNNPHDNRSGNTTETTPTLYLGKNIIITLLAKYSKQGYIGVKVTLGVYASDGTFHRIGSETINVYKSSMYQPYLITFKPSVNVIPAGSKITLILERVDDDSGGTLHILCGQVGSRIELWQPWE